MPQGLRHLLVLRWKAAIRRAARSLKSGRGIVMCLFGLLVFGMWLWPQFAASGVKTDPETTRTAIPFIIMLVCVTNVVFTNQERSVQFQAAEVDFLFSAPLSRTQLLVYKLVSLLPGTTVAALMMSVAFMRHFPTWHFGFFGCLFILWFVTLFTTTIALLGQLVAAAAYTWSRRLILAGVVVAFLAALIPIWRSAEPSSVMEVLTSLRNHNVLRVILTPFAVFGSLATCELWSEAAIWLPSAAGIIFVMLFVVLRLDADFLEASLKHSQRSYSRMRQARRSGVAVKISNAKRSLPMLPRWGGVGPLMWRQLTNVWRKSRAMLIITAVVVALGAFFAGQTLQDPSTGMMLVVIPSVLFIQSFPFDFRSDMDTLEWLKAMPVRPLVMAVGQLVVPVLVLTSLQLLLVGLIWILQGQVPEMVRNAAFFLLPLNIMLLAVENLLFLLFPARLVAQMPGDFQFMGRTMMVWVLKLLAVGVAALITALLAALVYSATESQELAWGVAWGVSMIIALAWLPAVAAAFRAFDVSRNIPA